MCGVPHPLASLRALLAREYVHAFLGIVVVTRGDGALLVGPTVYDLAQSSR